MAKARVIGLNQVKSAIKRNAKFIRDALGAALFEEALAVDAMSVRQVPVDTSTLKKSHFATPPNSLSDKPESEVGYGTDYAVYVHERMDLRHNAPTKAKYLEGPMNERKKGYTNRLARRTKRNWEQKRGVSSVSTDTPARPIVTSGPEVSK